LGIILKAVVVRIKRPLAYALLIVGPVLFVGIMAISIFISYELYLGVLNVTLTHKIAGAFIFPVMVGFSIRTLWVLVHCHPDLFSTFTFSNNCLLIQNKNNLVTKLAWSDIEYGEYSRLLKILLIKPKPRFFAREIAIINNASHATEEFREATAIAKERLGTRWKTRWV